jgi:hypothetical protein
MNMQAFLAKIIREAIDEGGAPTLSEGPKGRWAESDVTLRTGKSAKFGSRPHVTDLERVIQDLERIRARQSGGSATRAHISSAISALRKELRSARKRHDQANPVLDIEE